MKYKKYTSYKDSGLEWFGEIPSEWINTKLKYHSFIYNGNSISDNEKENYENLNTNFSIPYISTKDIDSNFLSIDYDNGMRISVNNDKFRRAKKGSSLICIEGGSAGKKLGLLEKDVCFVNKLACIDSYNNLDNKFCNYILRSSVFNYLFSLSTTGLIPGVSINQLKDFEIILPPLNEQQQIANFLDKATAKIDTLIKKQTKQIELLKEKRQAVISHAVTKGIKSNVKMKDSGVEWLGEIPEHWEVTKLKFYVNVKGRIGFRGYTKDDLVSKEEGALVIGASEMNNNAKLEIKNPQYISWYKYYESPEIILTQGDLLFVQRGSTVGKVAHIDFDIEKATINPSLVVLKRIKLNPSYLKYYLLSHLIKSIVKVETSNTAIPMISQEQIGNYTLSIPKKESEQQQIVNYLEEKTSKIDTLIEKSNKSIELLKEKRTALISAAVTGKIDVREKV